MNIISRKEDLRIVFMGTPEFAVETLSALVTHGYQVVGLVTQPDKPVGRHGSVLQAPAVKQYAQRVGIPVLQPEKLKDPQFLQQLESLHANLQVVVAYRMLPEVVWAMPSLGTFNVHAALLPDYRGAAPINWAIINGEQQTGVTTFFLDHQIDTGRIIRQREFLIPEDADVEYVYDGLMHLGAQVCLETLDDILAAGGHPASMAQDDAKAVHQAPKLNKDNCRLSWQALSVGAAHNFVRGLSPVPGAWTLLKDDSGREQVLKIYTTRKPAADVQGLLPQADTQPGTLLRNRKQLFVRCTDGWLEIVSLQLSGKKRMSAFDFLNGMSQLEKYSLA